MFADEQGDGVIHDNAQIISVIQLKMRRGVFRMRSFPHYRQYLQFHPEEWNSGDNSTVWYCPSADRSPTWALAVNRAGRVRSHYPDGQGEIKDARGERLVCG